MKQYRNPARLPALLLALTLAFSLTALPAAAEESGRPTFSGEVYTGMNYEEKPYVTLWENVTEKEISLQPGGSYPAEGTPMVTYERTDPVTITVNADIETEYTGISADAASVSIAVTAGNITATGGEGTGVFAAGDARITAGTITAGGDYSYGMRVFDGADVTADSVSAAGGTGVWARGSGATVSVQKNIEADRGIELGIQSGSEFGITVGGDVTAKNRGLYVIPDDVQTYDPSKPGRADVIIGGTLSGQNPIVPGNEIGNDSLNLTVWRVQRTGEDGKAMPYDEQNKFIVSETFDPTIRYIIRVQQPEKGATLTVKDEEGNELKAIETASGVKIDGVGPLKEGDLLFVVAATDKGYEVKAVYGDEGKTQALKYDETSKSWFMTVPKGGGVVISADVAKKTFTISFYNGETLLQTSTVEYGEMPEYDKDTYGEPTLAKTAQFTYSWNKDDGWTPTLAEAVEDASYYAKFTEKVNTYEVKFDTGGGTLNASGDESEGGTYEYGDEITLPDAVWDHYELIKWIDGKNDYKPHDKFIVTGKQTLTAVWQSDGPIVRPPVYPEGEQTTLNERSPDFYGWTGVSVAIGQTDNTPPRGPAGDNLTVTGTVGSETVTKNVKEVVKPLPEGDALKGLMANSIFKAAFDKENASPLDSGVVDFEGAFAGADTATIPVPSTGEYSADATYTVVLSNGTVLQVECTESGVLQIPFPKDAAGLGFVVLPGDLEINPAVKDAIRDAAYDSAKNDGKGEAYALFYAYTYIEQLAAGKDDDYASVYADAYADAYTDANADAYTNAYTKQINAGQDDASARKYAGVYASHYASVYASEYARVYAEGIVAGEGAAAAAAKAAAAAAEAAANTANAQQSAANANAAGATEATIAAGDSAAAAGAADPATGNTQQGDYDSGRSPNAAVGGRHNRASDG